jgi:hypothetical protein
VNAAGGGGNLADMGGGALRGILEAGLDPTEVAGLVVDAVKTGRFYILTHPEWKPMMEGRFEDILNERPPSPGFFPV